MSIVEKALSKLQGRAAEEKRAQPPAPPRYREPAVIRAQEPALPVVHVVPPPQWAPRQHLPVDFAKLQTEGVFPGSDLAPRVRDEMRRILWPLLERIDQPAPGTSRPNLIAITSSVAAEGKTTTTLNLARCLTEELRRRVLLIDGDVHKPQLSRFLGLERRPGFLDQLDEGARAVENVLYATDIDGLVALGAGSDAGSNISFIGNNRLERLLKSLADAEPSSVVLVDCPPLLSTSEGQLLARLAGQVVLVVRAGHTPQPAVLEAIQLLSGLPNVSCILNQLEQGADGDYHGRYYGTITDKKKK
jgi:Mrp family chromosome partitioning ATPase